MNPAARDVLVAGAGVGTLVVTGSIPLALIALVGLALILGGSAKTPEWLLFVAPDRMGFVINIDDHIRKRREKGRFPGQVNDARDFKETFRDPASAIASARFLYGADQVWYYTGTEWVLVPPGTFL